MRDSYIARSSTINLILSYALEFRLSILNSGVRVNFDAYISIARIHFSGKFNIVALGPFFISPYTCQSIIIVASGV